MLFTWLGTIFDEEVKSCFFCVWLPLFRGDDCRLIFLVTLPIFPAWLPANQHFSQQVKEINLYRVKPLPLSTYMYMYIYIDTLYFKKKKFLCHEEMSRYKIVYLLVISLIFAEGKQLSEKWNCEPPHALMHQGDKLQCCRKLHVTLRFWMACYSRVARHGHRHGLTVVHFLWSTSPAAEMTSD